MKRALLLGTLLLSIISLNAQQERGVFTATGRGGVATTFAYDYQSIGINPANLGWGMGYDGKMGSVGFSESSYSLYSEALGKKELRNSIRNFADSDFTLEEKQQAADLFADAELALNVDITAFAIALTSEKIGGFAFSVRERFQWYSRFNQATSEIMFMGKWAPYFDVKFTADSMMLPSDSSQSAAIERAIASQPQLYSQLLDGTEIQMSWTREFNLSYGRQLVNVENIKLYAGVGFKYVMGLSILDIEVRDGNFQGYTSISPIFNVDFGTAAELNPSTVSSNPGFLPKPVGRGFGMDFGVAISLGEEERLKLGASIIDIGSVKWDGNVYVASDDTLTELISDGFSSYNIFAESGEIVGGENGLFEWSGAVERKVALPTNIRMGGSYEVVVDKFNVGADFVIPGNQVAGSLDRAVLAFGAEVQPFKWVKLSSGFTYGGNTDFNIPVGILFISGGGTYESGIASRDAITFFTNTGPNLSVAFGFARFRF